MAGRFLTFFSRGVTLVFLALALVSISAANAFGEDMMASVTAPSVAAIAPRTPSSLSELDLIEERSGQRHFNAGTSAVIGLVAAFGFLQSTPRAAVFLSL
eukprot:CAMPEP_0169132256 /NCGR_PEP_ID=MMETSP1015-20121227/38690_1 /TAXON_ID=342587 /ORGANISM="Karlodinium micrum, Strain CCMP2283" /LENGTH=99 /DNA_ID=CAMNT_0009196585 /DNA_START=52 /DNA_END=351 /DNA_ORIENTATION=+